MPEIFMAHSLVAVAHRKQQKRKSNETEAQWKTENNWRNPNLCCLTNRARAKDHRDRNGHRVGDTRIRDEH